MDIVDLDITINLFLKDGIDVMNVMRYNEYHQIIQAGIDPEDLFSVAFADIGLNVADNGLYTLVNFILNIRNNVVILPLPQFRAGFML